jgi:DNA-binding HxlR family transcriptional regulator
MHIADAIQTEYSLMELGNTLRPGMAAMADWGLGNRSAFNSAPHLGTTLFPISPHKS